jgi:hypothetical protein
MSTIIWLIWWNESRQHLKYKTNKYFHNNDLNNTILGVLHEDETTLLDIYITAVSAFFQDKNVDI